MVSIKDRAKLWWKTQTPETKQKLKFGGLAAGVVGAVVIGSQLAGPNNNGAENAALKKAEAIKSQVYVESPTSQTPAEMEARIDHLEDQMKKLVKITAAESGMTKNQEKDLSGHISKTLLAKLAAERQAAPNGAPSPQMQQLEGSISALQNQIATMRSQPMQQRQHYTPPQTWIPASSPVVLGQPAPFVPVQQAGATAQGGIPAAPTTPAHLDTVNLKHPHKLATAMNAVTVKSKKGIYLPAGTILTGVLVNGLQAGTGPQAKTNPQIVDIRVKKRAILPNGLRANLENCMAVASGYGSIGNQKVYMRTNMLSCVARGGKVISAPIHAYIVGSDGLVGVSGKVVSHQGPAMWKSFIAGIFSGLGNAVQPMGVQGLNLNPATGSTQGFQMPSPSYIGAEAAGGGVSTSAGQISKFYLNEAESMLPTIQVNPAVSVSMILETGVRVHTDGESKSQIQEAQLQSAQSLNNSPMAPGGMQSPYGETSPYAGSGQSPAVASAFPNQGPYNNTPEAQTRQEYARP
jgi:conjugal transfer pilus assembly protein TraB